MAGFPEAMPQHPRPEQHYDPRFLTGFGVREIELDGRKIEIHRTNSLPAIIESVIAHEINEEPSTLQDIAYREKVAGEPVAQQAILGFLAEETETVQAVRNILEVRAFEKKDGALRLADTSAHLAHPADQETTEDEAVRDYYFSLAFDQIAAKAWKIDPGYDLLKFVQ